SWAAEGVLDSILHIDHAFDFSNRVADARAKLLEHGGGISENLDLDRLWRIGQITDHVLQHLYEFDIERRFGGLDLRARIFNDIVDGAAALGFESYGEVTCVGLGNGCKAHLQAGTPRCALHFRHLVQDAFNVIEYTIGLGERTTRRHDVVENESAFVHLREQVRAERPIAEVGRDHQHQANHAKPQRPGQRPIEHTMMSLEHAAEKRSIVVVLSCLFVATFAQQYHDQAGCPGEC